MELIHALNALAGMGIVIGIPTGLLIWNKLAKSGRWKNYGEARKDPEFWDTFKREANNKGQT